MSSTMGERIRERRRQLGLTQEQLAAKLNVSFQAVSKWETDASMPDVSLLAKLAAALTLELDQLLTGNGLAEEQDKATWGKLTGNITKDIHGNVGSVTGDVQGDIYGNVSGDVLGTVNNIYGNVEGHVIGVVNGDITGYVGGNLLGIVKGSVRLGVRGKVGGTIFGDGVNIPDETSGRTWGKLFRNETK